MSLTEKPKFLTAIIVALLLLNFGTLTFMWTHHPGGPRGQRPGDVFHFLVSELKMTDEQQKQYEVLRDEHHHQVEEKQQEGRKLHDTFYELLRNPKIDSLMVAQTADAIAVNQKQIDLITFYHFQKVRAICTPQQQQKFDEIIAEALRMMSPKPPRK